MQVPKRSAIESSFLSTSLYIYMILKYG